MAGPLVDEELGATKPLLGKEKSKLERLRAKLERLRAKIEEDSFFFSLFAVLVWVALGIFVGCSLEGWHFLTAFYFMVQVVTTIGYGDVLASEPRMKLFMSFYVIAAVMIIANIFSNLVEKMFSAKQENFQKMMQEAQNHSDENERQKSKDKREAVQRNKVLWWFMLFLLFVVAGTVFYSLQEPCSCSYGKTFIEGCVEGPRCPKTGGAVKTWVDNFYMSVITLTTVGFGDHSPKSKLGRCFGCIWMLLGVIVTGQFISTFGNYFLEQKKSKRRKVFDSVNAELFNKLDKDRSGHLSLVEFRSYALVKYELVSQEDLDKIDGLFKKMDQDGSGSVSLEEIQKYTAH